MAKTGECGYCGTTDVLTEEHVYPECIFPKPRPSGRPTTWVCSVCNGGKSKDDDYLRDMLVIDIACSNSMAAQALLLGPVTRSMRRNSSEIARTAVLKAVPTPVYSPSGLYIGTYPVIPLDGTRIEEIFKTIVKGLYHSKFNRRLADDYVYSVRRLPPKEGMDIAAQIKAMNGNGPYVWGEHGCAFMYADEDPNMTFWLLWFFESYCVLVMTAPPPATQFGQSDIIVSR